jgi:excisionase family DNA binding protein
VRALGATGEQTGRALTARGSVALEALAELVSQASIVAEAIEGGDTVSAGPVPMQSSCDCGNHLGASQLLLTPEQVAEALAIGRTRVYELMASGSLPSIRLGRSRRVARHALVHFIEGLSEAASTS